MPSPAKNNSRAQKNVCMTVQVYTAAWCRDCRAAKQFLDTHGIEYTEVNVDLDPAASDEVVRHVGKRAIPQLVIDGEWFQPYKPGCGLLYDELHKRFGIPRSSRRQPRTIKSWQSLGPLITQGFASLRFLDVVASRRKKHK